MRHDGTGSNRDSTGGDLTPAPWYVYIVQTENHRLYTGITTDPTRRLAEHQQGKGAKFFRFHTAVAMVYLEPAQDRSEASQREYALKRLSRAQKLELIQASAPQDPVP